MNLNMNYWIPEFLIMTGTSMYLWNMLKDHPEDILVKISVFNRGPEAAIINVLPTLWFRNVWSWGEKYKNLNFSRSKDLITCVLLK